MHDDNRSSLEAAAEAAAKVNAMLIAKGKLKPSQVNQAQSNRKTGSSNLVIAEVDINDVPIGCRNTLTRGSTQEEISKMSGAAVSTRGRYMAGEERMRNPGERALYLCVQGPHQDAVDLAVKRINEIIQSNMKQRGSRFSPAIRPPVNMVGPRHGPPMNQPPPLMSIGPQPPVGAVPVTILQEKLYIGLEHAPPSFDVKNKIMGVGASYLHHIIAETGAKVTLRGKGSGFIDPVMGRESVFEPMHVHIQHTAGLGMQQAKQLAENLIQTVQNEYASFQQALAAMPAPLNPGAAAIIAGIQQTSIPGNTLFAQQPGITTLSPLQQAVAPVAAPGVHQIAAHHGMITPQVLPVSTPTSVVMSGTSLNSSLSNLAPSAIITPAPGLTVSAGGPALVLPTTLGTSLASVVTSVPVSAQSIVAGPPAPTSVNSQVDAAAVAASAGLLPNTSLPPPMLQAQPVPGGATYDIPITDSQFLAPPGGAVNGSQPTQLILSQPPQPMPQVAVQIPQIATPFAQAAVATALQPAGAQLAPGQQLAQPGTAPPGPGVQIVTQQALAPPGLPPPAGPPLQQPQQFYSQYVPVSSCPPYSINTSSVIATSAPLTSTVVTSGYTYGVKEDPPKRRFTEEKQEDKIPENLLGYQHGPPHLTNLMTSGPPPVSMAVTMVSTAPTLTHGFPASSMAEDVRAPPPGYVNQAGNMVVVGPPVQDRPDRPDSDKHLMPPPSVKGLKRPHGPGGHTDGEKKVKTGLGLLAGYDEDSDEQPKHRGGPPPPPPPPESEREHQELLEQEHREHLEREQREYFTPHYPGGKPQAFRAASPPHSGPPRHSPPPFEAMGQQPIAQQPLPPFEQYSQHPQDQFPQASQPPPPPPQFDQFQPQQQFHPSQQLPPFSIASNPFPPHQSPPSPQPPYSQAPIRPPDGTIIMSQHNPGQPPPQQSQGLQPQFQNAHPLPHLPQNGYSQQFVSQPSQHPFPPPAPHQSPFPPPPGMQYW